MTSAGIMALLLVVVAGCSPAVNQPTTSPTSTPVFLPTQVATDGPIMMALVVGVLTEHDNCIWLVDRSGQEYFVIWPATYQAHVIGDRIGVADGTSTHRAFVGDTVELFGGADTQPSASRTVFESLIGRPIPHACRPTAYWVGGLN